MNQNNKIGQSIKTNISRENCDALISELSRECLRLEIENAELAERLEKQPSVAEQSQNKASAADFARWIREEQARR